MKVNFEARVISGMINNNLMIPLVISSLNENDFLTEARGAYKSVLKQYKSYGYANFSWAIENLTDPETYTKGSWSEDQLKEFCSRVKSDHQKREIAHLAQGLIDSTKPTSSRPEEIISSAAAQLFRIGATSSTFTSEKRIGELTDLMKAEQEKYANKILLGYDTGFPTLNNLTHGLQKKQLWIIGGYTSYGKSWFCVDLAWKCRRAGAKTLYITLEMSASKIAWRIASLELGISEYNMVTGAISESEKTAMELLFNFFKDPDINFWICDGLTTSDDIYYKIMEMKSRFGLDAVVIDYIQNIAVRGKEEYEALTGLARDLQRIAVTQDLLMIVASQNNRESLKGGKGFGYHGSSQIEKAADIGIIIEKPDVEGANYNLIFNVAKNRNGLTGAMNLYTDFAHGQIIDKGTPAI